MSGAVFCKAGTGEKLTINIVSNQWRIGITLNILRANKVANIADELYSNCINIRNILKYKGIKED